MRGRASRGHVCQPLVLPAKIIALRIKLAVTKNAEAIIRESVKPMERIDGIKIYQVEGLGGGSANASDNGHANGSAGGGSLADQVVNSALRYRGQAPLLDSLLKEIGLTGSDLQGLGSAASITRGDATVSAAGDAASRLDGGAAPSVDLQPKGTNPSPSN